MNERLVVDCDPGTDDAVALYLLSRAGNFPATCLATVGNAPRDIVARNMWLWTQHLGEKPFQANGADARFDGSQPSFSDFHGEDGLCGLAAVLERRYGTPPGFESLSAAAERICRLGSVTYILTGALTTLARLLADHPEVERHIARVLVMGGGLEVSNCGAAEYNFASDPIAVRHVFESGLDLTLFPLDLTCRDAGITEGEIADFERRGGDLDVVRLLRDNLDSAVRFGESTDAAVIHDLMPCVEVVRPGEFEFEEMGIGLGDDGSIRREQGGRKVRMAMRAKRWCLVHDLLAEVGLPA